MLYLKVMYADPADIEKGRLFVYRTARVTEDLEAVSKLPRENVLALSLSTNLGERKALVARRWNRENNNESDWWGTDNYVIGVVPNVIVPGYENPQTCFFADQFDDSAAKQSVRLLAEPHVDPHMKLQRASRYPAAADTVLFRGVWIDPVVWERDFKPAWEAKMF